MDSRYAVQMRLPFWGEDGQKLLAGSCVAVVGVGALGGHVATLLARAGVGRLRLIDPDRPALANLHRQVMYSEADAAEGRYKVQAAADKLGRANCEVELEPMAVELHEGNALELLAGAAVVLDCLDAALPRQILNEACLKLDAPLVHAGLIQTRGQLMVVRPGQGPCLRCWLGPVTQAAEAPTQEGIFGPTPAVLGSLQASEALKILLGAWDLVLTGMLALELAPPAFRIIAPPQGPASDCPACNGEYQYIV